MSEDTPRDGTPSRTARERRAERAETRSESRAEARADEREERGLFTGRSRRKGVARHFGDGDGDARAEAGSRRKERTNEDDGDEARPATGIKRTVMTAIRQIPSFVRLLFGLMRDGRVSRIDRLFVLGAVAYIISPIDFIPDLIPFLGETDDLFLLVLAVQRLIDNAGRSVLLDHWRGDPDELSELSLAGIARAAGFFLPGGIKKQLKRLVHR